MNPLFACNSFACNFIRWPEVFGVHWLEDVGFMNQSESPTAGLVQVRSTLEFANRPYRNICNMLSPRRLTFLWLACVLACADDEACALQKAPGKTKIRDNYVEFVHPKAFKEIPVQSVQFYEASHSITDGQPYEGVSSVDDFVLDVRAGRHGSSEVADYFNAGITGENALGLSTNSDSLPSELNFAVFGNLSVTIDDTTRECQEIRLAQGHVFGYNNWWMAGTKCKLSQQNHNPPQLRCPCGHTNVTFSQGYADYIFNVRFNSRASD